MTILIFVVVFIGEKIFYVIPLIIFNSFSESSISFVEDKKHQRSQISDQYRRSWGS